MKANINTSLLVVAGFWDLHLNGLSTAHSVIARHGGPDAIEMFENALDEYITDISEKRFGAILADKPEEYWDAKMEADFAPIKGWGQEIDGFNTLSGVIIAHLWFEYRLMDNESIWAEYLDLVDYYAPKIEEDVNA